MIQALGVAVRTVVAAFRGIPESLSNRIISRGRVIRDNVNDDLDAVLVGFRAHRLEVIFCTKLIVTDRPVRRLILPPPAAVLACRRITAHELHGRIRIDTAVCRRCLNS